MRRFEKVDPHQQQLLIYSVTPTNHPKPDRSLIPDRILIFIPPTGHQQSAGHHALRHRQVLTHRVPRVLRVLQPDVLDHLPACQRRGRR